MYIPRKFLVTLAISFASLLAAGQSYATTINFTIVGSIVVPGGSFTNSSVITATGSFDDSVLNGSGNGTVLFNSGGGNFLSIDLDGQSTLTEINDHRFSVSDGARFVFDDNAGNTIGGAAALASVDYLATAIFGSSNLQFDDDNTSIMFGTWDSATFTAVPVPAAVWLFGSGLAGLGMVGRRRKERTT